MNARSSVLEVLRQFVHNEPVVDCHDHTYRCGPVVTDCVQILFGGYIYQNVEGCSSPEAFKQLLSPETPLNRRWPKIAEIWRKLRHTGYARETLLLLREFYDEQEVSLDALERINQKLINYESEDACEEVLQRAKIVARVINVSRREFRETIPRILEGKLKLSPRGHLAVRLPPYHELSCFNDIAVNMAPLKRSAKTLADYLGGCQELFLAHKRAGAVAFKDQCAYERPLSFKNPARADAEAIFKRLVENPDLRLAYPEEAAPLDDFLFHQFMQMARELDLPVQLHTGKLPDNWCDCRQANAVALIPMLQQHRETRFELLHANWPYAAEISFLVDQYPNVVVNLCWTQVFDPLYCQQLMRQLVLTVPISRVHAFGADYIGCPDRAWAAAAISRENVAVALADLIGQELLDVDGAREIARKWLFENPMAYFAFPTKG